MKAKDKTAALDKARALTGEKTVRLSLDLNAELVKRLKHLAIDEEKSVKALVSEAVREMLESRGA